MAVHYYTLLPGLMVKPTNINLPKIMCTMYIHIDMYIHIYRYAYKKCKQ